MHGTSGERASGSAQAWTPEHSVLDPELFVGDPHPTYSWLRRHAPIHWDEAHRVWILTRYADVVHVSRHPALFCSGKGVRPGGSRLISIVTMDEPRHGQLRRLVNQGFTPRMVSLLQPRVEMIVRESIDAVAPRGACDFVRELAIDLPLLIIAEMLGIRREDRAQFHHWSDTMIAAGDESAPPEVMSGAIAAFHEFAQYLTEIFEDRRRQPQDDLVSILVAAQDGGVLAADAETISNDELLMFMTLLLVAGNETTRNAMSGGMIALMQNPDERAKLRARPELVPTAVEEIVRWVSPVINFSRTVTQDTELHGTKLREGQQVVLVYPAANRDEEQFAEAHRFKVDREPNDHIGFGIGNHFCLGANLARLELRVMFSELMRRIPDMQLAPGGRPVFAASSFVRGITELPVVFTPAP